MGEDWKMEWFPGFRVHVSEQISDKAGGMRRDPRFFA